MSEANEFLHALDNVTRGGDVIVEPSEWIGNEAFPSLEIAGASMGLRFSEAPTASALSLALQDVDRQARRTATAIERNVPPRDLFGRGVRLQPLAEGLIVTRAREGSLDVIVLLGGLYSAATSQPLSFALNVSSLLQLTRIGVRAVLPSGKKRLKQLRVAPTHRPVGSAGQAWAADTIEIPTPDGVVRVPSHFETVRFDYETADGAKLTFEAAYPRQDDEPGDAADE